MRCLALAAVCLGATLGHGQDAADPTKLMMQAAKSNGLLGDGMQPWHLKVNYKEIDAQGNVTGNGLIEELWAAPNKSRISYQRGGYSQTTYWTERGGFRVGDKDGPPYFLSAVLEQFVEPIPQSSYLEHYGFDLREQTGRSLPLACLSLKPAQAGSGFPGLIGHTYCLESGTPTLRISLLAQGGNQFLRNGITTFEGRSVPTDIKVMFSGRPIALAHVETIEALKTIEETEFSAPPGAIPVPRRVTIAGAVAQGMRIKSYPPEYPAAAKAAGVEGLVVLRALINTTGRVVDAKPVVGPPELRKAASDAVMKWTYRPYLLSGDPVEIDTTINVIFQLAH